LEVTKNVSNLINELRHRAHNRVLWIDAVCINQSDDEEKSNQVPQMRQIYQRAHSVIIWLPAHGDDARTVTALVAARWLNEKVEQGINTQSYPSETLTQWFNRENPSVSFDSTAWNSPFLQILTRPWFGRIWIIQEAVLAKNLFIHFSLLCISWDSFSAATLRFMSDLSAGISLKMSLEACYGRCLEKGSLTDTLDGISMVDLIHQLRAWNQSSDIPIAPSELVHLCGHRKASVQSDKIFTVPPLFELKDPHSSYNSLDIDY
jgi:hypothetical protein